MFTRAVCVILMLLSIGCSSGNDDNVPLSEGQLIYAQPSTDGNTFACATCHALSEPAEDGLTRPGHPIGDAANRGSYKDGQLSSLRDAVNTCRREWMGAPEFAPEDDEWLMLEAFLQQQAGDVPAEPLALQIVDPPADVSGGDPMAGLARFNQTCVVCHGSGGVGTERAPQIAGTSLDATFIATKIRRSGSPNSAVYPDLIPGRMPFWQQDRLSDDELRNIVAFLEMSEPIEVPVVTGEEVDLSQPDAQSSCGTTHPALGQTLTFQTHSHAVAGTATIIDDCTILFEGFSFDGGGIDVHIYGGNGGNYDDGLDLSINFVGTAFDQGSAVLRLPAAVTLDDFDGLSVWCVPVGFSFGDGQFQ